MENNWQFLSLGGSTGPGCVFSNDHISEKINADVESLKFELFKGEF
jgi:hypothetical protein